MKYAAQIIDGVVCSIIVVTDLAWAVENIGGTWVETFPDGSMRGKYACIGDVYDQEKDIFFSPPIDGDANV